MTVYALAGRRPDPPDAGTSRFPLENRGLVSGRIKRLFKEQGAAALVSSAACGSDLLALGVAEDLGMRRRIILPFDAARFRETSVTDRPGEWGPCFDAIIARTERDGDLIVLSERLSDHEAYEAVSMAILDEAEKLKGTQGTVRICLVWEGAPRGDDDLTYHLARVARSKGWPVDEILTL